MRNKKVLVIGLGISGRSAAGYLLRQGASVWAVDQKQDVLQQPEVMALCQQGLIAMHETQLTDLHSFDLVVVSPGVPQTQFHYKQAMQLGKEVIGEIELACRSIQGTFLGITGTNGKTTVTLLVEHVLNHSGRPARALGNSGIPLTSECNDLKDTIIVAELSSFQLETMHSQIIDAAVILNITPDHLDRYASMKEYAIAKMRIEHCLKPRGVLYVEKRCLEQYGKLLSIKAYSYGADKDCDLLTDGKKLVYQEHSIALPQQYQGKCTHDVENIMAAYSLCCLYIGVSDVQFFEALATFKKPSHRIEFIATKAGVRYYDDSKGTNIDAVIRAVETLEGKIILIAGGVDKGSAYTPWIRAFQGRVQFVCAIGQAAVKIKQDLSPAIPVELFPGMEEAVAFAAKMATSGDIVLLSPGCSSFDMFRDYAHRGREFQRIVRS